MKCPHCKKRLNFAEQGHELISMWLDISMEEEAGGAYGCIWCFKCGRPVFELYLDPHSGKVKKVGVSVPEIDGDESPKKIVMPVR